MAKRGSKGVKRQRARTRLTSAQTCLNINIPKEYIGKSFLKSSQAKSFILENIESIAPASTRLVEPFAEAGEIFLKTNFPKYLINVTNPDLINLYRILQRKPDTFIQEARKLFTPMTNSPDAYYDLRTEFNSISDNFRKAVLFFYMNRHGYNGLIRYNQSSSFNVPFGKYKKPYFPENELYFFAQKAQKVTFTNLSYSELFSQLESGDTVFCNPPYVPLRKQTSITNYSNTGFGLDNHAELSILAESATRDLNAKVIIVNHDTIWTRKVYEHAKSLRTTTVKSHNSNAKYLIAKYSN